MKTLHALITLTGAAVCSVVAQQSDIVATVVDRAGNRHEVSKLTYQGGDDIEIYVGNQRRILKMQDVDRLTMQGDKNDEEQQVAISLRTGEVINATIFSGGSGSSPHQDSFGGGSVMQRFGGVTELGPFLILMSEVSDVLFLHPDVAEPQIKLKATVINEAGERFEVSNLRFRGKRRFEYFQGLKLRSKEMERISRLDFSKAAAGTESRTVTITFRSGRTTQGTVDASTVRLAGETNRIYEKRVGSAFTGSSGTGDFGIGLNDVKLIRFHEESEETQREDVSGAEEEK
jgi:hypothetical protein